MKIPNNFAFLTGEEQTKTTVAAAKTKTTAMGIVAAAAAKTKTKAEQHSRQGTENNNTPPEKTAEIQF